jgi:hypothetical protein
MLRRGLLVTVALTTLPAGARANDLFRDRVAPLLESRCLPCHDAAKKRGGLDLSTRAGLLAGSDAGPVLDLKQADQSRLLLAVSGPSPRMPRAGPKLAEREAAWLRRWVAEGATWPDGVTLKPRAGGMEEAWWSLRELTRPPAPGVTDRTWARTPVDPYILAALEQRGLRPSPEAGRRALLRRLSFDLTGLPPTPEEIDAFVGDPRPDAYERIVDRLLASPAYGERWGRHWLDVAHYADTHGYDKDKRRDSAWPYRDWVIRALNADLPYRDFVRGQLAGDVLRPGDPDGVVATGFVVAGPWDFVGHVELREGTVDKEKTRLIDRDDMVTNAAGTFLSLTVGCARCHDHKFDPIPTRDYYRLQAVFAGVERGPRALPRKPGASPGRLAQAYAVVPIAPRPVWVLRRGDVEQPKEPATPGALSCVTGLSPDFPASKTEGERRLALANWTADGRNPLTWRSIANRVWHYHFGRGIVDTPNDFGKMGGSPTHPELLDWLAAEARDAGSLKRLHRLVVTSAAYRQASAYREEAARVDADNRYLWRMGRQRLDAEGVRDAVLAVSGRLDRAMGGPGYELFRFRDDHSPEYDHSDPKALHNPATYRRTVYRFTVRSVPNPLLDCLDSADPNQATPVRNTTLTALQALALMNNPFVVRQAGHFAGRLRAYSDDPDRQVEQGYRLAFGRAPTSEERAAVAAHVREHGLAAACRMLLNANEFVFVD